MSAGILVHSEITLAEAWLKKDRFSPKVQVLPDRAASIVFGC
jgi:hypothetical protein